MNDRSCFFAFIVDYTWLNTSSGTARYKPCLWPITDTECQVWAQMSRSTFLKLILWRRQISIEKIITNIVLSMTASTNIIFYFYSKIRIMEGRLFFNTNPYNFHNNTQFCIFVHITKSSFCHVFVTSKAFVTIQDIEQEYRPKDNFIIIE